MFKKTNKKLGLSEGFTSWDLENLVPRRKLSIYSYSQVWARKSRSKCLILYLLIGCLINWFWPPSCFLLIGSLGYIRKSKTFLVSLNTAMHHELCISLRISMVVAKLGGFSKLSIVAIRYARVCAKYARRYAQVCAHVRQLLMPPLQ